MSEGAASSRLVIVDDHEMVRGGIKKILAGADDFTVVGEAAQGDEALRVCALVRPDLVLVDLELGAFDGLSLTRAIREAWPATRVVVFSINDGDHYRRAALEAGAGAYLVKGVSRRELLRALRGVTRSGSSAPAPATHVPSGTRTAVSASPRQRPQSGGPAA